MVIVVPTTVNVEGTIGSVPAVYDALVELYNLKFEKYGLIAAVLENVNLVTLLFAKAAECNETPSTAMPVWFTFKGLAAKPIVPAVVVKLAAAMVAASEFFTPKKIRQLTNKNLGTSVFNILGITIIV